MGCIDGGATPEELPYPLRHHSIIILLGRGRGTGAITTRVAGCRGIVIAGGRGIVVVGGRGIVAADTSSFFRRKLAQTC